MYGAARIAASLPAAETMVFFAMLNVFLGLFNLLPLPPLDGGRSHQADQRKVLPLAYAVAAVLLIVGLAAVVRDIIDPLSLG